MRIAGIILALASLCCGGSAMAARTFVYTTASGPSFAYVSPGPLDPIQTTALDTCTIAGCAVGFFGAGANDTIQIVGDTSSDAASRFRKGTFATPGFHTALSGTPNAVDARLTIVDIPEYSNGSILFVYTTASGASFTYVSPGPLDPIQTAALDTCTIAGCAVGFFGAGANDTVQIVGDSTSDVSSRFSKGTFATPGFHAALSGTPNAVDARLAVVALPDRVSVVPEPASWAMMVAGFSLLGSAVRRRRISRAGLA